MKTLTDYFEEEWHSKIREGRKEGRREGQNSIIINMIKNKLSVEDIEKYTGIDKAETEKIVANM